MVTLKYSLRPSAKGSAGFQTPAPKHGLHVMSICFVHTTAAPLHFPPLCPPHLGPSQQERSHGGAQLCARVYRNESQGMNPKGQKYAPVTCANLTA